MFFGGAGWVNPMEKLTKFAYSGVRNHAIVNVVNVRMNICNY